MLKVIVAFLIALSIGAVCRYFEVPVPAPPKLLGALLIVSITVGYLGADWLMTRQTTAAVAAEGASERAEVSEAARRAE